MNTPRRPNLLKRQLNTECKRTRPSLGYIVSRVFPCLTHYFWNNHPGPEFHRITAKRNTDRRVGHSLMLRINHLGFVRICGVSRTSALLVRLFVFRIRMNCRRWHPPGFQWSCKLRDGLWCGLRSVSVVEAIETIASSFAQQSYSPVCSPRYDICAGHGSGIAMEVPT